MDIEGFYDGDRRRRDGEDVCYGMNWSRADQPHRRYDLYWNDGTGELYLIAKPIPNPLVGWVGVSLVDDWRELEDIEHRIVATAEHLIHPRHIQAKMGRPSPRHSQEALTQQLDVEVLGSVPTQADADRVLEGWQQQEAQPDSLSWLRARLNQQEVTA